MSDSGAPSTPPIKQKGFFRKYWKELLAVFVAMVTVAGYLFLRNGSSSSSGSGSTLLDTIPTSSGGGSAGSVLNAAQAQAAQPQTWTVSNGGGANLFASAPASSIPVGNVPAGTPLVNALTVQPNEQLTQTGPAIQLPWGNTSVAVLPVEYAGENYFAPLGQLSPNLSSQSNNLSGL